MPIRKKKLQQSSKGWLMPVSWQMKNGVSYRLMVMS